VYDQTRKVGFGYLVTAKHVVKPFAGKDNVYARMNKHVVEPGKPGVQYLKLPNKWIFHDDPAVDLAVLPWENVGDNYTCTSLSFDDLLTTPEYLQAAGVTWPPGLGEDLVYIGLMSSHMGTKRNLPIVRRGHLGLVSDEAIAGPYGPSQYHLANIQGYPGHSGGPVWALYGQTMFLFGVLSSGFDELEELEAIPIRHKHKGIVVGYYNLGVTLVTPVEKLRELLQSPKLSRLREQDMPKTIMPVPLPRPKLKR
jgi:hypothetical protein